MTSDMVAAPVLSTPDDVILQSATSETIASTLTDDQVKTTYEIDRVVGELQAGKWKRVALQFPDHMLVDAPRVAQFLEVALLPDQPTIRVCVLADTSYSACCVDEIAAEHTDADVVVHYGRTCLSPTSRLPAIYIYTNHELDYDAVVTQFSKEFPDKSAKIVIAADITCQNHVESIFRLLSEAGYTSLVATEATRDPAAPIPNRKLVNVSLTEDELRDHALFHISDPPMALLLALKSRFASLHVLSTSSATPSIDNPTLQAAGLLRRRFAKVLMLASAGVIGILVNTLSVSNYLESIDILRDKIAKAGKKSYTVVVGKLNPAKLANFSEIEGWVVVGCWESGLVEDDGEYWRPVITPFEMEVALRREEDRIWGDEWWAGVEKLTLDDSKEDTANGEDELDEDESLPPEFDLRTGRLISTSRPMRQPAAKSAKADGEESKSIDPKTGQAIVKRAVGELASINGVVSPGAEYLRSQRTWQGLGSDFDNEASTLVEEGRSGVARGYTVGEEEQKH